MLRQIHNKQDKMIEMVEAAQAARSTSNEKYDRTTSHKKGNHTEFINNLTAINDFATHLQKFENGD